MVVFAHAMLLPARQITTALPCAQPASKQLNLDARAVVSMRNHKFSLNFHLKFPANRPNLYTGGHPAQDDSKDIGL